MGMTGTDGNPGKGADDSGNGHNPNSGGNGDNGGDGSGTTGTSGMTGTSGNPGKNADDSNGGYTGGSVGTGLGSGKTISPTNSYSAGGYGPQNGTNPNGLGGDNGGGGPSTSPGHEGAVDHFFDSIYDVLGPMTVSAAVPEHPINQVNSYTAGGFGPQNDNPNGTGGDNGNVNGVGEPDGPEGDPDPTRSWIEKSFGWMTGGPFSSSPAVTSPNLGGYPGGYGPQNTSPNAPGGDNGNVNGVGDMPGAGDRYSGNHMPAHDVLKEMQDRITNAWHDHMDPQDDRRPIVLDLDDNGIQITQAQDSHQYVDMTGDGYKHQTAWAGAGDGVLFYDFDGDGQLTQSKEVVFSDWDPGAKSDMQALKDIFDTNHDGKFDSSDAHWADFKVMVTNADGTYSVKTLAELGIKSIDLTENATKIVLPDGSSIDGQTTYTKTDNSVHTVATVTFAVDANGYAVQTSKSVDGSGVTTIDIKTLNHDGTLAGEKIVITSADGLSQTTKTDANGDGVIDKILTDVSSTVSGVKTETLTDTTGAGSLVDRTTIVTSTTAGVKTVATSRDQLGGGWNNQTESLVTNADSSTIDTITNIAFNGSTINQTTTTISADGLSRTTSVDIDGNGTVDGSTSDVTIVDGVTGARTETLRHKSAGGPLQDSTVTVTDKVGQNKTVDFDVNGDGTVDWETTTATTVDGSGHTVITTTGSTGVAGDPAYKTITTESQDGLWVKTETDIDGDGLIDRTKEDATVVSGGARAETITVKAHDGSLLYSVVTTKEADGISREIDIDFNGDGHNDNVEIISVDKSGVTSDVTTYYGANGTNLGSSSRSTTADGLTVTRSVDHAGLGVVDSVSVDQTVKNANGSSTETIASKSGSGALLSQKTVDTSADGLSVKTQVDINGDGTADNIHLSTTTLNADGSKQVVVTDKSANGTLIDLITTQISTDRKTVTVTSDFHGLGKTDRVETLAIQANGDTVDTVNNYAENGTAGGLGTLLDSQVTTISGNGLSKTVQSDYNGDGTVDSLLTDVTLYNADGTVTDTINLMRGFNQASKSVSVTSADRHTVTTTDYWNGDATADHIKSVTAGPDVANGNYDQTATVDKWGDGTAIDQMHLVTSKDGLESYLGISVTGLTWGRFTNDITTLNSDGSTTETRYVGYSSAAAVNDPLALDPEENYDLKQIVNVSKDGMTTTSHTLNSIQIPYSIDETIAIQANGDTVDTKVISDGDTWSTPDDEEGPFWELNATRVTTSGNGLSKTTERDVDGNGTYDIKTTDVTTIASDGTRTETVDLKVGSTLKSEHVHSVSGNGLTTTDKYDYNGNGVYDLTTIVAASIAADGSQTTTSTDYASNGSELEHVSVVKSGDGKTVTTNYYDAANKMNSTSETTVTAADGSVTTTGFTNKTPANTLGLLQTHYESGNDLITSDNYYIADTQVNSATGKSNLYSSVSEHIVYNPAGSITASLTQGGDQTWSASDSITAVLSADGLTKISSVTLTGAATSNFSENETTTISPNAVKKTITDTAGSVTKDVSVSTWTNGGLGRTIGLDVNGDGTNDLTDTMTTSLSDGKVTDLITNYNYSTKAAVSKTTYSVVMGHSLAIQQDTNADGTIDSSISLTFNEDGSDDLNTSTHASAVLPAYSQNIHAELQTNGSTLVTQTQSITAGLGTTAYGVFTSNTQAASATTISADGLHKATTLDVNGDGFTDQATDTDTTFNSDGSILTEEIGYSTSGSKISETKTLTTHDGNMVVTSIDLDGNGIFEQVSTYFTSADGNTENDTSFYDNKTGADVKDITSIKYADGLTQTINFSGTNAPQDRISHFANANGSYQYTRSVGGTQIAYAMHAVDAALVDTWSWNISNKTSWATTTSDTVVAASGSVVIDLASEQKAEATAAAIYGAAYGRQMTTDEHEMLAMYIANGSLNTATLSTNVLASSEFAFRYGSLDNAAFVTQIFKNAFGFVPSSDVLAMYTSQLISATMTKAQVLASISQSALDLGSTNGAVALYMKTMNLANNDASSINISSLANLNSANAAYYFLANELSGPNLGLTDAEKAALQLAASAQMLNADPNGQYDNLLALIQNSNMPGGIFGEAALPTTVTSTPIINTTGTASIAQNNGYVNMAASSKTTLTGNSNMIAQNASSTLTVTGDDDMVEITGTAVTTTMSNGTVVIENSAVDTLTGDKNQIMMLTSGKVTVTGNGSHLTVIGTGNTATVSNADGVVEKSGVLALTGSNDEFYIGASSKLTAAGSGNLIHVMGSAATVVSSVGANNIDLTSLATADTVSITGGVGAETIDASKWFSSKDTIAASTGTDTLIVNGTHAAADFANTSGIDVLQLGYDPATGKLNWGTVGASVLTLSDAFVSKSDAKTLTVNSYQSNAGTTIDASALLAAEKVMVHGDHWNNTILGGAGADTLDGGGATSGVDLLKGGAGANVYKVNQSYGSTEIDNSFASGAAAHGELDFGTGLTTQNLWMKQVGSNLEIDMLGTTDHVTIDGWFGSNASAKLSEIKLSDGSMIDASVSSLVSAMAAYQSANPGFNAATAVTMPTDTTLQASITASWHH